jgi:U6 snRNA-associated Sm-like protein LSm4
MLPLTLLKAAENHPMLIELKNGDTYNGRLVSCNMFMNICLKDVICTSRDGDRFWRIPECYIRGNSIKYLRIPDEVIDMVADEEEKERTLSTSNVLFANLVASCLNFFREEFCSRWTWRQSR